ncbi:MAG: RnfABCDGE type electron transport complex subunit D [Gallionella sp.]|nr:RnfABCDGE type electron transport complex subunit D [Gallionella sp.]MDD4958567.1 RnfABCDGE type electron transport complex subunit D [Gallionella sp.]
MNPIAHSPHAHAPITLSKVMMTVMMALIPATLYGFWLYGWSAVMLWMISIFAAIASEALVVRWQGRGVKTALLDGSGVLTAWLLAISLPPTAPWWIAVLGSVFAVTICKQVFGGLGQNVFNPAMAARVMLLISFPLEMTTWVSPVDGMASASVLGHVKTELTRGISMDTSLVGHFSMLDGLVGNRIGSMGETAAILLLLGGVFLIFRRIITWHIPVAMMLGVAVPALLFHSIDSTHYASPLVHLLSGGLILGAFFIATDPVTSPNTAMGQLIFGAGCGLMTWIIRTWGGYPEGVAFAVLMLNAGTPIIDHYVKPRIYGRDRKGVALPVKKG